MAIIQHLIVDEFGAFVGKKSERLIVSKGEETLAQAPLLHLETVLIGGNGVSMSADAVRECAERGIPIHFVSKSGTPYASLDSAGLTATVQTRHAQLLARDSERGLHFVKAIAAGKIRNQANLLKYLSKNRKEKQPALFAEISMLAGEGLDHLAELERYAGQCIDDCRGQILSSEGRAAQKYWRGVGQLLLAELNWPGRRTQGAADPLNAALNYGYGILYSQVERALVLAGLDPYAGFLHVDRPGKPSLVFDVVEEFRQTVVDRTVIAIVNRGMALALDERGRLTDDARHTIAAAVLNRLEAVELYEGKRFALRQILQSQARHLATYLRGERTEYAAFVSTW